MSGNITYVNFRDDILYAVERDDGVFVAVKPICDALGLAWTRQLARLKRDPILSEGMTMMVMPSPGGAQETTCLKLELVNGWLFTIDSSRIQDEEVRQKVLTYQRECYSVLFQHFYGRAKATVDQPDEIDEDPQSNEGVRVRMVTEARHTFGTQAAGQLWMKLGLPITPAMLSYTAPTLFDYAQVKTVDQHTA